MPGITYPSGQMQKALMKQVYEECGIRPRDISYIEAHGTGTKAGDPEEVNAIAELFCKGRDDPLLIGSTKSNIGHSEPASDNVSDIWKDRISWLLVSHAPSWVISLPFY